MLTLSRRLFFLSFLILGLTACTGKNSGGEKEQVKIGLIGPLSGGSAPLGLSFKNGVQMAVDEINSGGGILGKKIDLLVRDDEAKNEKGALIIQELLDKEGVSMVIGPINTGVADAATKYSNRRKVPHFISVSSGAKVNELFSEFPDNYVFRFAVSDEIQSTIIVKEAITNRKFKKPAILCDDTNFGQAGRERLEKHLAKANVAPVFIGKFKLKDTDMTAQLQQAKAAGADVILAYGLGAEMAAVSNSMEKIGWKVPIVGAWTLSMPNYVINAKNNAEGTSMPMSFIEAATHTDKEKNFLESYYKKFNEKPIPSALAAVQSYDAVYLFKQAVEQAQSFEGAKVKAALENLEKPFIGVTGTYNKPYSTADHEALKEEHLKVGTIKGGVVVPTSLN
jgi:branched-chain amino acid transport system substrate-binding protein